MNADKNVTSAELVLLPLLPYTVPTRLCVRVYVRLQLAESLALLKKYIGGDFFTNNIKRTLYTASSQVESKWISTETELL